MWISQAKEELLRLASDADIVICPPYILIQKIWQEFSRSQVRIGAQDVSKYDFGAYTGEVTAGMLLPFCSYCIIGHSERKKYFGESAKDVSAKVKNLLRFGLTPILCIKDQKELEEYIEAEPTIFNEKEKIVFVYEPPGAISQPGKYQPEDPENAGRIAADFKSLLGEAKIIYGGSTNPENISSFLAVKGIDGALVGQASWQADTFLSLIKKAIP